MGELALTNLTSPMILFFVLGLLAALTRSDLTIPEAIAKGLSIYLMLAIGFKGGAGVAEHGVDTTLIVALLAGIVLSAVLPVIAFPLLTRTTRLSRVDAAAIAACYGSNMCRPSWAKAVGAVIIRVNPAAADARPAKPRGLMVLKRCCFIWTAPSIRQAARQNLLYGNPEETCHRPSMQGAAICHCPARDHDRRSLAQQLRR